MKLLIKIQLEEAPPRTVLLQIVNEREQKDEKLMQIKVMTNNSKESCKFGIGITAANTNQQILAAWALIERSSSSNLQDEAEAVRPAMMKASERNWKKIKLGLSNKRLVRDIQQRTCNESRNATLLDDIHSLSSLFS